MGLYRWCGVAVLAIFVTLSTARLLSVDVSPNSTAVWAHQGIAAWVQAIGSVGAIIVAILIAHGDTRRNRQREEGERQRARRSLVNALKAELRALITTIQMQRDTAAGILKKIAQAKEAGQIIDDIDIPVGEYLLTDARVFAAAAAQIGILSDELATEIVRHYGMVRDVESIGRLGGKYAATMTILADLFPRVLVTTEVLIEKLRIYETSGYSDSANLSIPQDHTIEYARRHNYPFEKVLAERGLKLSV